MTPIILSDEQVRLLESASPPVVLFDSHGRKLAEILSAEPPGVNCDAPSDDAWTEEALQRKQRAQRDGLQGSTTQEVLARLRALKAE